MKRNLAQTMKKSGLAAMLLLGMLGCNSNIPVTTNGVDDDAAATAAKKIQKSGVASFRMVRATMAKALGVNINTTPVPCQTVFDNVKTNLGESFDSANYSDAAFAAVYDLAGCFCNQFATNAGLRGALLPSVNFALPPSTSMTAAARAQIANAFIDVAWDPALKSAADVQDVQTLLNELVGLAPNTPPGTQAVVEGACRSVLASLPTVSL